MSLLAGVPTYVGTRPARDTLILRWEFCAGFAGVPTYVGARSSESTQFLRWEFCAVGR